MNTPKLREQGSLKTLRRALLAGLIAGTLDALAAMIVYALILGRTTPSHLWQGVASVCFGKDAFQGGPGMVAWGLFFHYWFALCFALGYFIVYPYIRLLWANKWLSALFYGAFAWCFMNLAVLPIFNGRVPHFRLVPVLRDMGILIVAIGIPIALIAAAWYRGGARLIPMDRGR